jgi:hypothetical protein
MEWMFVYHAVFLIIAISALAVGPRRADEHTDEDRVRFSPSDASAGLFVAAPTSDTVDLDELRACCSKPVKTIRCHYHL